MRLFVVALLVLGGVGLTVQQAVNSRLRVAVGSPVLSALISFGVGAALLGLLAVAGAFGRGRLTDLGPLPWWAWTGGLFGAFYVTLAVIGVPRVGAAVGTIKHAIDADNTPQLVTIHIAPGSYGERIGTSKHIHFVTWGSGTVQTGG